jgi:hypothetical protein
MKGDSKAVFLAFGGKYVTPNICQTYKTIKRKDRTQQYANLKRKPKCWGIPKLSKDGDKSKHITNAVK